MTLAFFAFLAIFYLVPLGGSTLVEWLWRHAADHLPFLMLFRAGRMVFNGAFYAAILAAWAVFLSLGSALSGGGGRTLSLRIVTRMVGLLALALVLVCLALGKPAHGPLSLALVVFLTSLLPAEVRRVRPGQPAPGTLNADGSPAAPAGGELAFIRLSPEARPLTPTEPPPLDIEAVAEKARDALTETPQPR